MEGSKPYGLYIYRKERKDLNVLKDLLQFVRSHNTQKTVSFAYIEAETSLIPNLSLWENLQLINGENSWKDLCQNIDKQWMPLVNLIQNPHIQTSEAKSWEKFLVSLLKGLLAPGKVLLIDFNEDLFPPLIVQNLKKNLIKINEYKTIYLASASTSLWLDCAHSIVTRNQFEFEIESLDQESIKRHWAA